MSNFKKGFNYALGYSAGIAIFGIAGGLIANKLTENEDLMVYLKKHNEYLYRRLMKFN